MAIHIWPDTGSHNTSKEVENEYSKHCTNSHIPI
jgi:hypothetical protein